MATYNMQCPMAANRLKLGYPATFNFPAPSPNQASSAIAVAETVQVCRLVGRDACCRVSAVPLAPDIESSSE